MQEKDKPIPDPEKEMDFWDHLEDLRHTIFRCLAVLLPGVVIGWFLVDYLSEILQLPLGRLEEAVELIFSSPLEGFMTRIKLAFFSGLFLALPFCLYFIWRFVAPGLNSRELKVGRWSAISSLILFVLGAALGFAFLFFTVPLLARIGFEEVRNLWSYNAYLVFCIRFMVAFGLVFELPLIMCIVVYFNLTDIDTLRKGRRYAIVGAFLTAALLTPPEPFTQFMLGIPLVGAYEIGLLVASRLPRREE